MKPTLEQPLPATSLRVTVVQNAAGRCPADNLARIDALLAPVGPEDLVVLPEVFPFRDGDEGLRAQAEPPSGGVGQWMSALARRRNAWVVGGVIEQTPEGLFNTAVVMDPAGQRKFAYRKIHLFEARLDDGRVIREADVYQAGDSPVLFSMGDWRLGLSICYDLRFPELYREYSAQGAQILLAPSNFTQRTGRDHWEILTRARAIENQSFMIAPDQCGVNPGTGVASYGHSMAIGPWGEVLALAGDEEAALTVTLTPAELAQARNRVPALRHRRR